MSDNDLIKRYSHCDNEFPVLSKQTHKVLRDRSIVNEQININDNIINYVQDTALLISEIDGSLKSEAPYDHVVYLDKSARPVSWLVNMFWDDFSASDAEGNQLSRPPHSYINIDRAPWFRNVGIDVTDDDRQKTGGELATYWDFIANIDNLSRGHLAEIRALYIDGGIETEDADWIMKQTTRLTSKRVLVVDEVSRTGSTLKIAVKLFQLAFPDAEVIDSAYFWHPHESALKMGSEDVLTSLPVWYDPNTYYGRGIGGLDEHYYKNLYKKYLGEMERYPNIDIKKFRTYAFSSSVLSTPLLDDRGKPMGLAAEKKTRELTRDLKKLHDEYKAGRLFFVPPFEWVMDDRFEQTLKNQGVLLLPENGSERERERIRKEPDFYLNFIEKLRKA